MGRERLIQILEDGYKMLEDGRAGFEEVKAWRRGFTEEYEKVFPQMNGFDPEPHFFDYAAGQITKFPMLPPDLQGKCRINFEKMRPYFSRPPKTINEFYDILKEIGI